MPEYTLCKSHIDFICVVAILASCLYCNTVPSGFVWDDRAAIIGNADVHGTQPLSELFQHDFWGQDMTLHDSHKSYRPLTVLTYRFNHWLHGLSAMGYHAGNVVVYICACVAFYLLCISWLKKSTAQLAVLLFCIHPVHVESVASIVGRADALCGVFYCLSTCLYSRSLTPTTAQASHTRSGSTYSPHPVTMTGIVSAYYLQVLLYLLSMSLALASSLSKEIGITVFGVFVIMEVLHHFREGSTGAGLLDTGTGTGTGTGAGMKGGSGDSDSTDLGSKSSKSAKSSGARGGCRYPFQTFVSALVRCFCQPASLLRMGTSVAVVAIFLWKRVQLHGGSAGDQLHLYQWTILENHIHLLPDFKDRALSYAQTHFWYIFKLLYPRYLCFDYGFLCLPTIHLYLDSRNLLPLAVYFGILALALFSLLRVRIPYVLGLTFLLLPLIPALNILFPVGTLLAERLLFIPSMGFCVIVAEFLLVDLGSVWPQLGGLVRVAVGGKGHSPSGHGNGHGQKQGHVSSGAPSPRGKHHGSSKGHKASADGHGHGHSHASSKYTGCYFLYLAILLPIALLCALRIFTRNQEWQTEISVYGTALAVCPNSIKALNNYGLLSLGKGDYAGALSKIERSIELYPGHAHAYLNAGVASAKMGDRLKAVHYYDTSIKMGQEIDKHKQSHAKAYGYKGMMLFDWSQQVPLPIGAEKYVQQLGGSGAGAGASADGTASVSVGVDGAAAEVMTPEVVEVVRSRLRDEGQRALDYAIEFGFDPPSVLHSRASLAIEKQDYGTAVWYLQHAIRITVEAMRNPDVPKQDLVSIPHSYNQLALAHASQGHNEEAVEAFNAGLVYDPSHCEIMANLGNLYRGMGSNALSRDTFQRCINSRTTVPWDAALGGAPIYNANPPPAAVFNNYGLLEMDNFKDLGKARHLFTEALRVAELTEGVHTHGYDVMRGNLDKVTEAMRQR